MEAVGLGKDFKLGRGAGRCTRSRNVSFGLYRGAVVALVGESGSGKSTVAKLLAGQERPTRGPVTLDGKPVDVRSEPPVPPVQAPGAVRLPGPVQLC